MRICFWIRRRKRHRRLQALSCAALFALSGATCAQTLARPGWAGSGVTIEPWWRHAVFYRIDPANFQDSDGDGKGDLAGVTQRLGYLQSLGVDAIVLRLPNVSASPETQSEFAELARAAAEHKLRVLVELTPQNGDANPYGSAYLSAARFWLNQGAAGVDLDTKTLGAAGDEQAVTFVRALHALLSGFPGGRILIANAAPVGDAALAKTLAQAAQLVMAKPLATNANAATLRTEMEGALGKEPDGSINARARSRQRAGEAALTNLLLSAAKAEPDANATTEQQSALQRTMAMLLLGSRAGVMIDAGEEIGASSESIMQWTPKNITPPHADPIERPATATITDRTMSAKPKPDSSVYGAYVPYVPPAKAKPPEMDMPTKVDPDSLPGFTSGVLPLPVPLNAATVNVALENGGPRSLLNLYRRLIQLHHGNASVHSGAQTLLNHDDANALVWVRRPPAGAKTAATVVAVCNLSGKQLDLSVDDELKLRGGTFHTLAGDAKIVGDRIIVAAESVWLGQWQK